MAREELSEEMRTKFSPELVAKAWDRIVVTGEVTLDFFEEIYGERAIRRLPPRRAGYFQVLLPAHDRNDAEPRASPPAELVVEGIDKWFRTNRATTHALDDVSFRVAGGEFVCLVGPSGCGKSTLLDIIAGLTTAGRRPRDGRRSASARSGKAPAGDVSGVGAVSVAQCVRQRHVRFAPETGVDQRAAPRDRRISTSRWSDWKNTRRHTSTNCRAA